MHADQSNQWNELGLIIQKSLEDSLSPEESHFLRKSLLENAEALRFYIDFVMVHGSLFLISNEIHGERITTDQNALNDVLLALAQNEKTAPAIENLKVQPQRELIQNVVYPPRGKRTISKFSIFSLITSAAVVLFFVVLNAFSPSQSRPVASITGNYNAVWKNLENTDGSRLWNDGSVYHLQHGIAEITFDKGAKVLIESPADLEVMDENEMYIRGRMTANVPGSAYGFTVNTINSKVVDLGTEFGLLSSDKNGTEVHVRKGKVEHEVYIANSKKPSKNLVEAGQASHADNNGGFSKERFQGAQFRWDRPMSYETAVLETRPVAYYRFEKGVEALGFDEISRTVTRSNASGSVDFVGGLDIGSEFQNHSLRLTGGAGSKVFVADKVVELTKGDALSISLWVRPEQVKVGGQNIIAYTGNDKNTRIRFTNQLYLTDDNRVGFYLFDRNTEFPIQIESQMPASLNQWFYVAVGYDKEQVRLYVNGQLQASQPVSKEVIPQCFEEGYWAIGAESGSSRFSCLMFEGSVDEISFYGRQLSDAEVKMLYEAAPKK